MFRQKAVQLILYLFFDNVMHTDDFLYIFVSLEIFHQFHTVIFLLCEHLHIADY